MHTILPERISATPNPDGGWTFDVMTDYRAVLKECGSGPPPTAAVMEALRGDVG